MTDPKLYKDLVFRIIGAAMSVQDELNWGMAEAFYTEALHIELEERGIDNQMEKQIPCYYKGKRMEKYYQPDIMAGEVMIGYWLNEETNECILLDRSMNPVYDNPHSDYYTLDKHP